jgi:hypothetical protein
MSSGGQVAKLSCPGQISFALLIRKQHAKAHSWFYNPASRQICRFSCFVDPMELEVKSLRSKMFGQYVFWKVADKFLRDCVEDIDGSYIQNLSFSAMIISRFIREIIEATCEFARMTPARMGR